MPQFFLLLRDGDYSGLSPEEMQKVVEKFIGWARKLRAENRFKAGDGLKPSGRMLIVKNGKIVDGPFIESKEQVGGYYQIEAKDYDEAVRIAHDCPELQYGGSVEIRQIMDY